MSVKKQKNSKKSVQAAESSQKRQLSIPLVKFRKQSKTRLIVELVVLACVVLVGITGYLWWTKIFMDPAKTLSDALSNSLSTRSITRSVDQSSPTSGIKQVTYLSFFGPEAKAETDTTLTQGIASNATSVATQTIGTSDSDYVRYTDVKGGNQLQGAQNLKSLLGTWAKRQQNLSLGQQVSFLNESMFGVVPFGYLGSSQKSELISLINQKNIYRYTDVKREIHNHRPVFIYDLSIKPRDLVEMMQQYVRLNGSGDPSQLDPTQYEGLGDVKVKLTIDILSRQVVEADYSTGRIETYSGHNLYHQIDIPKDTIPVEELQKRIQGLGGQSQAS